MGRLHRALMRTSVPRRQSQPSSRPDPAPGAHPKGNGLETGDPRQAASAWRILAFSIIAMTMTVFGQTTGVAVFVDPVAEDLKLSRSEIATVYSVATLVAALFLPTIGRRIDRHGVRRLTLVVASAFGLVIVTLAFTHSLLWLAVGFFGIRLLGQGALTLAARTIVALRFQARLGSAVGISSALATIGMSFAPFILATIIGAAGWRMTWVLAGVSVWIILVPMSIWFLRPGEDRPAAVSPAGSERPSAAWTRELALRTPMFWVITLVTASTAAITTGLAFHQISILGEAGLSPILAAANFVPQTIASVATLALVAPLSDRVSPGLLLAGSMACIAAAIILLLVLDQPWVPLIYALALGGAFGSSHALEGTLHVRFFGLTAIAAIRGTAFMGVVAGAALGPVLVATIREATGSYGAVAPLLLAIPLAIGAAALIVPVPRGVPSHPA